MQVWNLLLIGILSVLCQRNALSATDNPSMSFDDEPKGKINEDIFSLISQTLGAYARVTIGLHILGELIEPTSENLAICGYMNINDSIFDAWMEINGKDSEFIINAITSIKTSNFHFDGFLEEIAAYEDIFTQFEKFPLMAKEQYEEMGKVVEAWGNVTDFSVTRLKSLEGDVKAVADYVQNVLYNDTQQIDKFTKMNVIAMRALELYPQELETVASHLKKFNKVIDFTDLYGPIRRKIEVINGYISRNTTNLIIGNSSDDQNVFSQSATFKVGSRIAQSIKKLGQMDKTTSLGRIWSEVFKNDFTELALLKKDLDDDVLKNALNGGEALEALKKVLKPFFEIGEIVSGFWTDSDAIFKDDTFRNVLNTVEQLLTQMSGAETSDFKKSMTAVTNMLKVDKIPDELKTFVEHYDAFINGLQGYQEIVREVEDFQKSPIYQNGNATNSNIEEWERAFKKSMSAGKKEEFLKEYAYEKYSLFRDSPITQKFDEFNNKLGEFRESFAKINLTLFPYSGVKSLTFVTEALNNTLVNNKNHLSQVKSALSFIEVNKEKQGLKIDAFITKFYKIETIINEKKKQLDTERAKLKDSPDAEFYKEAVKLNKNYGPLKEKLIAGSNLFKIFHKIVRETKFDDFFKAGDALHDKILELKFTDQNRFEWILKMKKFKNIRQRYDELKKEILILKENYWRASMGKLIQVRWLIENLYDLPNPELKLDEWKAFAELDSLKNNVSGAELTNFQKAMEEVTDLDFAAYQRNVLDAYANLRGLIRFHNAIVATEKISSKTYWDWNHQWIEIVAFAVITLALNALAYGCASLYIRRKNMALEDFAARREKKEQDADEKGKAKEKEATDEKKTKTAKNKAPNKSKH